MDAERLNCVKHRRAPVRANEAYCVSDLGFVIGRARAIRRENGRIHYYQREKVLKTFPRNGYPSVQLRAEGKSVKCYVHDLVAEAFLGPRPAGMEIDHFDGNRANNCASNLSYVTRSENLKRAFRRTGGWGNVFRNKESR